MDSAKNLNLRILVVEDHEETLAGIKLFLELQGNNVSTAGSVAEAKKAIEQEDFDILLCDTDLPDGSGLEVPKFFKPGSETHKIATSGKGSRWDQAASYAAGFQWYLQKPFQPGELAQLLLPMAELKKARVAETPPKPPPRGL